MDVRTDRVGLLLDQLDSSVEISRARLPGLTDEEFRWEPAANCWSIRRRSEAATSWAYGPGEWVLDFEPEDKAPPALVSTIAWRLGHLQSMFAGRWEWTFGSRTGDPADLVDFSPEATATLDSLWQLADRWRTGVERLTDTELDQVGFGQYPWGLDPQLPIISIVWWINRELIHHLAEVALLRDLWAAH